jgi:hypothetical protein
MPKSREMIVKERKRAEAAAEMEKRMQEERREMRDAQKAEKALLGGMMLSTISLDETKGKKAAPAEAARSLDAPHPRRWRKSDEPSSDDATGDDEEEEEVPVKNPQASGHRTTKRDSDDEDAHGARGGAAKAHKAQRGSVSGPTGDDKHGGDKHKTPRGSISKSGKHSHGDHHDGPRSRAGSVSTTRRGRRGEETSDSEDESVTRGSPALGPAQPKVFPLPDGKGWSAGFFTIQGLPATIPREGQVKVVVTCGAIRWFHATNLTVDCADFHLPPGKRSKPAHQLTALDLYTEDRKMAVLAAGGTFSAKKVEREWKDLLAQVESEGADMQCVCVGYEARAAVDRVRYALQTAEAKGADNGKKGGR